MRQYLLPEKSGRYKANLHCHSTYSDGRLTPSQLKALYQQHGYSIIAFTDHDILVPHDDLTDESFLSLTGYEMEIMDDKEIYNLKTGCHLCFISIKPDTLTPVCLHHSKYMFGGIFEHFNEMAPFEEDYEREYSVQCVNHIISEAKNAGFFVTYNHPVWSLENYSSYSRYTGMDAVEMFNGTSLISGFEDCNGMVYDDLLRLDHRIGCTGNDDNHNIYADGDPNCDSCIAWNVICADKLEYTSVTDALLNRSYYSSTGPDILQLYVEDGKLHVECSEARSIIYSCGIRHNSLVTNGKEGTVTSADFNIGSLDKYFRITVVDKQGFRACSNAYWLDELEV